MRRLLGSRVQMARKALQIIELQVDIYCDPSQSLGTAESVSRVVDEME
jgi:hypothetical protein